MAGNGVDVRGTGDEGRGTRAPWRRTADADRRVTRQVWWEHRTWTIRPLVGVAGLGLLGWSMLRGAPMSAARGPRRPPRLRDAVSLDYLGRPVP